MRAKIPLTSLLILSLLISFNSPSVQIARGQGTVSGRTVVSGRHYALLIGVEKYQHSSVNSLSHPVEDTRQVQQVLTSEYSFDPQDVTLLSNPDRKTILAAFDRLTDKAGKSDQVLIFYAGHGHWDEQRRQGYWLPSDAQWGDRSNWISNSDLRDAIRGIESWHTLLISDACFSGSLFVTTREAFGRPGAVELVSKPPSRTAMTSGALTTVPDKSVFISYLLKRLRENQESYLLAADLFSQLRIPVINNSGLLRDGTIPTPRYGVIQESGDEGGEFVFVRRSAATLTPVIAPPPGDRPNDPRSAPFTTASVDASGRVARRQAGPLISYEVDLGGAKLEMVAVPGGRFQMGASESENRAAYDDTKRYFQDVKPELFSSAVQHWARVSDFRIGRYEVTQRQWKAVMGGLPPLMSALGRDFHGDELPVMAVTWDGAKQFCEQLDAKLGLPKGSHRLPTEAEWEYAARGGTQTPFAFGQTITPDLVSYLWNFPYGAAPKGANPRYPVAVGSFGAANPFGLFDMHGNVWEWCEDWYGAYPIEELRDPTGPSSGVSRVIRGGAWSFTAAICRSAHRYAMTPNSGWDYLGFRVVRK